MNSEPISYELQIFNSIADLNWAWMYESDSATWIQFECINCMVLESKWRQKTNDGTNVFKMVVEERVVTIRFNKDKMTMEKTAQDGSITNT